ncbi:hypothetical protein [Arthrobacter sp. AD-310]
MSLDNHTNNRALQQDAKAWAAFTGCNYTAALRQMKDPRAQGYLGERMSARQLITTLKDHILIGDDGDEHVLGEWGFYADDPFQFNQKTDYVELALTADMLRMFTPLAESATPEVGSYSLKHTVENFLRPHFSYITNGRLIWAAAALGLPIAEYESDGGPNLLVGIPEREHDYVRRVVRSGQNQPQGHHHRPPGYKHLHEALQRLDSGEPVGERWVRSSPKVESAPFHDWLVLQADRDDPIGDISKDYAAGVRDSDHRIARTPDELMEILEETGYSYDAYRAAEEAVAEWNKVISPPTPLRTQQISSSSADTEGYGAGSGTMERYEFFCPCGDGKVVEEHDNAPGFREHDVWIECDKCRTEWRFLSDRSVRDWALEPVPQLPEQDSAN